MQSEFNSFRLAIGLETFTPIWYWSQWNRLHVPFSNIWSHHLVPKPKDWGEHIRIAGYVFHDRPEYTAPADLVAFLSSGKKPIYVGFGSSWIPNSAETFDKIFRAISEAGVRAVVMPGSATFDPEYDKETIFMIQDCPHDWLFPKMSALITHGGAGVTAMAMRTAKPTLVCPIAGDMAFWGYRVWKAGCGPKPLPVQDITSTILVERIKEVLQPKYAVSAAKMAAKLACEKPGAEVFASHAQETFDIYEKAGRCDILADKPAAWKYGSAANRIQLSAIVAHVLLQEGELSQTQLEPLMLVRWPAMVSPGDPATGLIEGVGHAGQRIVCNLQKLGGIGPIYLGLFYLLFSVLTGLCLRRP